MITTVSIQNFKCLRDVRIDLERLTIFVGSNASGKLSVLQALNWLCRLFRLDHPHNLDGELLLSLTQGAAEPMELACECGGRAYRYRTRSSSPSLPYPTPQPNGNEDGREGAQSLSEGDWTPWRQELAGPPPLPEAVLLRLETSRLVQPHPASDSTIMQADGTGLHTALANLALNEPDSWQALQANLRRIIPTIRRLRHTRALGLQQPTALLFDTVSAASVPATQVSEGILLVVGLLTVLHASDRPNLVLLSDLGRGLHPKAQRELIELLRGLLQNDPALQIIATTHSPYLLDCMEPSEVRMTHLNDDGSTVCAALSEHPKFEKWKNEFHSGEMWSLFGEQWVVERGVATP